MTFQFEVNKKDLITKRCSLNVIKNIYKNRLIFMLKIDFQVHFDSRSNLTLFVPANQKLDNPTDPIVGGAF